MQLAGLVAVPINFRLVATEIAFILENSEARGLLLSEDFLPVVEEIGTALPAFDERSVITLSCDAFGDSPFERLIASAPGASVPLNRALTTPSAIFYTSGTTGFPKGAVLSGLNLFQRIIALGWELGIGYHDIMLVPGPLFHMSFSFMCIAPLCIGGRSVIESSFDPDRIRSVLDRREVTRSFMVPKMLSMLLENWNSAPAKCHPHVHHLLSSGSALPLSVFEGLQQVFPNARITESMGWTESSWIVMCPHEDIARKNGSAGRAAFGADLAILDDQGNELGPGRIGQIYGACPVPFLGYHNNFEATAAMRRGRWETGGDIGYTDEEGFLYILDRKRDMIISGGENIYPAEIERVIQTHPDVAEVSVIGIPDDQWGETPRACVVLAQGRDLAPDDIIRFCRGKLAGYKLPRSVAFIPALPRNSMGKVLKRELRVHYSAEIAKELQS
jgi:acyl-CoA synthetase (AMP-forming)/AMP-acid ligase II